MDRALVIAGTSFVGRHLLDRLHRAGVPSVATARTPMAGFVRCDLHDVAALERLLRDVRPRWLFQCAGATAQASTDELVRLHCDAARNLLEVVARHTRETIVVLIGSAAEYGPVSVDDLPIREETTCRPASPYGRSKLAQTQVAAESARQWGLRIHVVRPFNLLGAGLGPQYFASALCERLRQCRREGRSEPISIANAAATRDWVDVRDAVDAMARLALDAPPPAGEPGLFNIATGQETTVLELGDALCRLAGAFHAVDGGAAEGRSGIDRSCGDASRLRAATGWAPQIDWRRSLHEMWTTPRTDRAAA